MTVCCWMWSSRAATKAITSRAVSRFAGREERWDKEWLPRTTSALKTMRETKCTSPANGVKELCLNQKLVEALELAHISVQDGELLTTDDLYCLLQGCINKRDVMRGREVHSIIKTFHLESSAFLGSHLIRLFDTCGCLSEARQVFKRICAPNVFAWTAIISAHAKFGEGEEAMELYWKMQASGVKPDRYVFVVLLKACSSNLASRQGIIIHSHIIESDFELDLFVTSILIDMYSNCGSLSDAQQVFNVLQSKDVVVWNSMIAGYAEHGHGEQSLRLFKQMQQEGIEPNNVSFLSVLKACCLIKSAMEGMRVHASIMQSGFVLDISLSNALIDMYAKCGSLEFARHLFEKYSSQDVVAWNTIITGYAKIGCMKDALSLFHRMKQEGIEANTLTWNSIIAGHAQCGHCQEALKLFNIMRQEGLTPDIITWNTFLAGLSHHGRSHEALWLFQQMLATNVEPSVATFVSTLKACSVIGAIYDGHNSHSCIIEQGLETDLMVSGTLIDMYAKCGSLEHAISVFNKVQVHNVVTWSALIAGLVHNNYYDMALNFFNLMLREGCKPNEVTFVSVFSACSYAGLVDEGYSYFMLMQECYGIRATLEHYNCLVDLLGAAGYLLEAKQVLLSIPFQRNIIGWTSLLSSCRQHKDIPMARRCFERALAIDSRQVPFCVMMANIYNDAGMMEDREQVLSLKRLIEAQRYQVGRL